MNRTDRRQAERRAAKRGQAPTPFALQLLLDEGKRHHQAGRLDAAEQAYRQALELAPDHPEALHLMGLSAYRAGRLDTAIDCLRRATERTPSAPLYWFNFGVVTQRAGRFEEAVHAYQQALKLNPHYVEACINLGNALKEQGRIAEAVAAYRQALALNPSHADTHNNLGVALKEQGKPHDAVAAYRQALSLAPMHLEALNNLGLALMELDALDDAVASFKQALAAAPHSLKALYNLGIASIWKGRHDQAVAYLHQAAAAKHDRGKPVSETFVYRSRLKHDAEQLRLLLELGRVSDEHRPYLSALDSLRERVARLDAAGNRVPIETEALRPVAPSFNRFVYLAPCERIETGALNPNLNVQEIEARYFARQPEVAFIDTLLTPEALSRLRQFCLESTIWKKDYENGYIGAFLGDGFATPLLLQIAEELHLRFPRIFARHRLTQAWAFKHDSARRGLTIHADAAAVNVNFWITPDEANLNQETGGLVVYDKEAPKDWNFAAYNSERNKSKILEWLANSDAQAIRIPYRANRAVVFNSDLFHETDEVAFRDEYLSRRINVTLLYGHRHLG